MLVSVLMSVYAEPLDWLEKAINSILTQTFSDFEFIIVNDNPERKENRKVLSRFAAEDTRIVVVENTENIGLTKSLNKGIKVAKGKYIARMDADDISLPDRLSKQVTFLLENEDYIACGSRVHVIDEQEQKLQKKYYPVSYKDIVSDLLIHNPIIHPTLLIKTEAFKTLGVAYNEKLRFAQDYQLIVDLLEVGKVHNCKEVLLWYRKSNQQITNQHLAKQTSYANQIRVQIIEKELAKIGVQLPWKDPYNSPLDTVFQWIDKHNLAKKTLWFNNFKVSLLINSHNMVKKSQLFKTMFERSISIKNRLKLLKILITN
ncbi:glycosyltransferase [Ochrovirga pacifica]|uniref:glycosyltransferase n=1 Tax=Ochrovirga pacifica TaxID=1042376 RepID=UPI000255A074|nr:glycosyltransferase [Ochrovirga pacifica]